jgi:uncharacterized protein YacL
MGLIRLGTGIIVGFVITSCLIALCMHRIAMVLTLVYQTPLIAAIIFLIIGIRMENNARSS